MEKLKALLANLSGYKTYLCTIALAVVGILWKHGDISNDTAEWLALLLGPATGLSIRAAIQKSGPVRTTNILPPDKPT